MASATATAAAVGLSRLEFECSQVYSRPAVVSISAERPRAAGISDLSALGLLVSTILQ